MDYEELDKLADTLLELSDNVVIKDSRIDSFIADYRDGIISRQELVDKTYQYLKGK